MDYTWTIRGTHFFDVFCYVYVFPMISMVFLQFPYGFAYRIAMVFLLPHLLPNGFPIVLLRFPYGFPMVFFIFLWFPNRFPMVFVWLSFYFYGCRMVLILFLWFFYGFLALIGHSTERCEKCPP